MKASLIFPSGEKIKKFLKEYKLVLFLIAVGIVLLAIPQKEHTQEDMYTRAYERVEEDFSVVHLEEKLSAILSRVEGAGEVSVMLTVQNSTERTYAADRDMSEQEGERELREKTVIISTEDGESPVLIGQTCPTFQGALLVCEGGDDPAVRLRLTQAMTALTGLNSNRITVCKGS